MLDEMPDMPEEKERVFGIYPAGKPAMIAVINDLMLGRLSPTRRRWRVNMRRTADEVTASLKPG